MRKHHRTTHMQHTQTCTDLCVHRHMAWTWSHAWVHKVSFLNFRFSCFNIWWGGGLRGTPIWPQQTVYMYELSAREVMGLRGEHTTATFPKTILIPCILTASSSSIHSQGSHPVSKELPFAAAGNWYRKLALQAGRTSIPSHTLRRIQSKWERTQALQLRLFPSLILIWSRLFYLQYKNLSFLPLV